MARNFSQYPSQMRLLAAAVTRFGAKALFQVGKAVAEEVIPDTPVDKGGARSNWLGSLNSARGDIRPPISTNPVPIINEAISVFRLAKADDTIHLVNNLPYIADLDRGRSPQAGPGFIRNAFRRGTRRGIRLAGTVAELR